MNCCPDLPSMSLLTHRFIGCDGNPVSDSLLRLWIEKACEEENYEWAGECRDEIIRRNPELIQ